MTTVSAARPAVAILLAVVGAGVVAVIGLLSTLAIHGGISPTESTPLDDDIPDFSGLFGLLLAMLLGVSGGLLTYVVVGAVGLWRTLPPDRRRPVGVAAFLCAPVIAGAVLALSGTVYSDLGFALTMVAVALLPALPWALPLSATRLWPRWVAGTLVLAVVVSAGTAALVDSFAWR